MRYTIEVTQADIDTARTLDRMPTCWCPVALAIKRASGRAVWVERTWVAIGPRNTPELDPNSGPFAADQPITSRPHIPLPIEATLFIEWFDVGRPVKPFSFTLDDEQENQPA